MLSESIYMAERASTAVMFSKNVRTGMRSSPIGMILSRFVIGTHVDGNEHMVILSIGRCGGGPLKTPAVAA